MDVHLADERVLVLPDHFDLESAEARAATKRASAFGTLAKMAGLLGKPREDEFELVYKERRLQPYWFLACTAVCAYERTRRHSLKLPPEVRQATIAGETHDVVDQQAGLTVLESCREELKKEATFDALTGQAAADLTANDRLAARPATPESLAALSPETVVVPPQAKASVVVREVLSGLMGKIEADKVLEETVAFDVLDICYRPIYAFRYRRQGKEAVVEVDGVSGEVRLGGATFEALLGKVLEPRFLLEVGAETVNLFIPGATLVKVLVAKGMDMRERR